MRQSNIPDPDAGPGRNPALDRTSVRAGDRARRDGRRNSPIGDDCDDCDDSLLNYLLGGRDPNNDRIRLLYMYNALYC